MTNNPASNDKEPIVQEDILSRYIKIIVPVDGNLGVQIHGMGPAEAFEVLMKTMMAMMGGQPNTRVDVAGSEEEADEVMREVLTFDGVTTKTDKEM